MAYKNSDRDDYNCNQNPCKQSCRKNSELFKYLFTKITTWEESK